MNRLNKQFSDDKNIPLGYLPKKVESQLLPLLNEFNIDTLLYSILIKHDNIYSKKVIDSLSLEQKIIDIPFDLNHDILGFLLMCRLSSGDKNRLGVVFTPSHHIKEVLSLIPSRKVYDPAAGSGAFLIESLKQGREVLGVEIDPLYSSVANSTLNYINNTLDVEYVKTSNSFDVPFPNNYYVVGNPPWGIKGFSYPINDDRITKESFEAFIYKNIKERSSFSFLLPQSILFRKSFKNLRRDLYNNGSCNIKTMTGFPGINVEVVLLTWSCDVPPSLQFNDFKIERKLLTNLVNPNFVWRLYTSEEKLLLSNMLPSTPKLKELIKDSWMGVVTGNNEKYIYPNKKSEDDIPILTGKNIKNNKLVGNLKYFDPKNIPNFNQVNTNIKNDQEKIVYSFIGKSIKYYYDKEGYYTLNSLNYFTLKDKSLYPKVIKTLESLDSKKILSCFSGESLQNLISDIGELPINIE